MTQYSCVFPTDRSRTSVGKVFQRLKESYNATLIGLSNGESAQLVVNPDLSADIEPGSTIYYIADDRINDLNWQSISD